MRTSRFTKLGNFGKPRRFLNILSFNKFTWKFWELLREVPNIFKFWELHWNVLRTSARTVMKESCDKFTEQSEIFLRNSRSSSEHHWKFFRKFWELFREFLNTLLICLRTSLISFESFTGGFKNSPDRKLWEIHVLGYVYECSEILFENFLKTWEHRWKNSLLKKIFYGKFFWIFIKFWDFFW